jgi:hypothetical protein
MDTGRLLRIRIQSTESEHPKMRLRFSIRDLLLLTAVIGVVLGWLRYAQLVAEMNAEADLLYHGDVTLSVIDAETKEILHIMFVTKGTPQGQRWPRIVSSSPGDINEMRVEWLAIGPIKVGASASADGYEIKAVELDRKSSGRIVVPLRKLKPGQKDWMSED